MVSTLNDADLKLRPGAFGLAPELFLNLTECMSLFHLN